VGREPLLKPLHLHRSASGPERVVEDQDVAPLLFSPSVTESKSMMKGSRVGHQGSSSTGPARRPDGDWPPPRRRCSDLALGLNQG
jgi:hypothetical protein